MHINTTNCVVFLHGKLNNILIHDWVTLFQHIFFLSVIFMGWKTCQKQFFWTHLDTGCSVKISFLLISWWLYHYIICFWRSLNNRLHFWVFVKNFSEIKEKYVFMLCYVTCQNIFFYILLIPKKIRPLNVFYNWWTSLWRVCFQRGLPRLVLLQIQWTYSNHTHRTTNNA